MAEKVRIDKWLWSIRIFKTRTLATHACKSGKVRINDVTVKPSYLLQKGEKIQVHKGGFYLQLKSLELIQKRVGAPIAITCYENLTPEEELNKYNDWFVGKAQNERREKGSGRPTKKERREIDGFKGDF